jgi:hypothetical protein
MKSDFDFGGEDYSKKRNKNKYSKNKQAKKIDRQKNSHSKKHKIDYEDFDEEYRPRNKKIR